MKIEHIGIAVTNLEEAEKLYSDILNSEPYKREEVKSEGVITSFFNAGEPKVELLAATNELSPIAKFISKRGPGVHHIAYRVENLEKEIERLVAKGYEFVNSVPKIGADNKRIVFLHPKGTGGVLIELCEER